jgi:hypothetical protein
MAFSNPSSTDDGFATPAAALASLALAILAIASVEAGMANLGQARAGLERAQAEWSLAGGQQRAQLIMLTTTGDEVIQESIPTDKGTMDVLAEAEAPKLAIAAAADLDDQSLRRLGATDAEGVRGELAALSRGRNAWLAIRNLDPSAEWRRCVLSFISPFGTAIALPDGKAGARPGLAPPLRVGQVWRIRVSDQSGWADDRLVRFTGDRRHPAATIERALSHGAHLGGSCDASTSVN